MLATILTIYAVIAVAIGIALGFMAQRGGGSFGKWLAYGALLPFIALPKALLIMRDTRQRGQPRRVGKKKCMYCHHKVDINARSCPKCGYEFIDFS
jgi:ribosomal protein L40E